MDYDVSLKGCQCFLAVDPVCPRRRTRIGPAEIVMSILGEISTCRCLQPAGSALIRFPATPATSAEIDDGAALAFGADDHAGDEMDLIIILGTHPAVLPPRAITPGRACTPRALAHSALGLADPVVYRRC